MARILITGGLGFIGRYLANLFFESGFNVRILDLPSRADNLPNYFDYRSGSVEDSKTFFYALGGEGLGEVDYVLHLAALSGYSDNYSQFFSVNVGGTAALYKTISRFGFPVKQIIIASSEQVYGEGKYFCHGGGIFFTDGNIFYPELRSSQQMLNSDWNVKCPYCRADAHILPSEESDRLNPVSPYGISKMTQEKIALLFGAEFNIPTTVLRYAIVSGAYPEMTMAYPGAIKFFTEKAVLGEPVPIHEDGNQLRNFVNIKDLGDAHLRVLNNPATYFKAFNVGADYSVSLIALAREVYTAVGAGFKPVFNKEFRPFTPRHWVVSNKKIKFLGWDTHIFFEESVEEYVAVFKRLNNIS